MPGFWKCGNAGVLCGNAGVEMPGLCVVCLQTSGLLACVVIAMLMLISYSPQTLDLRALDLDSIDYEILPIPTLKRVLLANNRMTSISGKKMEDALSQGVCTCAWSVLSSRGSAFMQWVL